MPAVTVITTACDADHAGKCLNSKAYWPAEAWQSLQFTAVMSPRSTGCWNGTPATEAMVCPLSVWLSTTWQDWQSLLIVFPSALSCCPS